MSVERVREVLADRRVLVLTGAGVSTDSGIPDYRGPGSTPRTPMTHQEFLSGPDARRRYWARSHVGWARMGGAEPNAAHHVLARWEREGRLVGLITQNVDGLHERAGHVDVVDLHGRIDRVVCLGCGELTGRGTLQQRLDGLNPGWADRTAPVAPDGDAVLADADTDAFVVADCTTCGGALKPDVVFFGGSVAKPVVQHCFDLTEQAEAVLVLGSSLHVMSGLRFVRRAAALGTPVVIVNRGTTRADDLATATLHAGCSETVLALDGAGVR